MKKKLLLTSILTIVMCFSLIVGSTFALFTSESKVNVAVTSGTVKVEATVDNVKYKALNTPWTAANGTIEFDNIGGSATIDNGLVTLDKIVPGDGISFDVNVINKSDVATKFRTIIENATGANGEASNADLFNALVITIDGVKYYGETATAWTEMAAATAAGVEVTSYNVAIELPEDASGEKLMGKSVYFTITVQAIQGNAETVDNIVVGNTTVDENNETTSETNIGDVSDDYTATAPAGTALKEGATTMTLSVNETEEANTGNFEFAGATTKAFDIVIHEVAENNDQPIVITLEKALATGLDAANIKMFHNDEEMTRVATPVNHNEFSYDPATGDVVIATKSFSTFTVVTLDDETIVGVTTAEELTAALAEGRNVKLLNDITAEANTTAPYGNKYAFKHDGGVIDGNNHSITLECWGDDYGIMTLGGTIKNLELKGDKYGFARPIVTMYPTQDLILENVKCYDNILYGFNTTEYPTVEGVDLIVNKCTIGGWTSFAGFESVTFTECDFVVGNYGYGWPYDCLVKPYYSVTFKDCSFAINEDGEGYYLDVSTLAKGNVVTLDNCKVGDTVITVENCDILGDTTDFFGVELPTDGRTLADCVTFITHVSSGDELQDAIDNGSDHIVLDEDIDLSNGLVIG